ncbi:hypothetical protein FLK61_39955 [Paenalkalicoccus suaedae]|uniref:Uncharacterized protein n=1 Tax=Paenalkalicoccus suaedae TaxID=2592382 RepID=A0A859FI15_9BACI|nr:hypothetical protein [Paenalkalicoccus suaedae]QKS72787.1 hypothetical protein FLK61_39955 [Paenalkalicoccus suaedae]
MRRFVKDIGRSLELLLFLGIGLYITEYVAGPFYEGQGIRFEGNVWVNWFAISYVLFVVYVVIMGLFLFKNVAFYRWFLSSVIFWILCAGAIFVVVLPVVVGENPF